VSAESALPGEPTVAVPPALPAAITKRDPCAAVRSSTACSSGSMLGESPPPRLMLTTGAAFAAHCMPARIADSSQNSVSHTLPIASFAPGATPLYLPPDFAPLPAMIEATCVPWPTTSSAFASVVKFSFAAIFPAKSGWVASMPESRIATVTPVPSRPACQAAGAPICGTLTSRSSLRLPSR
jgi:hypothetical protein